MCHAHLSIEGGQPAAAAEFRDGVQGLFIEQWTQLCVSVLLVDFPTHYILGHSLLGEVEIPV